MASAGSPGGTPSTADAEDSEPPPEARTRPSNALRITLADAILSALANNRELVVQRVTPEITRTAEQTERAVFDPVLGGELGRERRRYLDAAALAAGTRSLRSDETTGSVFLEEYLPTGTTLTAEASTTHLDASLYDDSFTATRAGLTVTQALLRGAPIRANLANLRQARLDTTISEYELRAFVENLVAAVEETYWDYALTARQVAIVRESLGLAERQLNETHERVKVGRLSEAELAAAQAEVAQRHEELIDAKSAQATTRLHLLRLLNPPGPGLWEREVVLLNRPSALEVALEDVDRHVAVAMQMRPDMNQARLQVRRGDLEIVQTRDGLLPKLDFFITLGRTGYAKAFGRSANRVDGIHYDVAAGLSLEFLVLNRGARAQHRRALLSRRQALQAVENLAQLVNVDVRSAHIAVQRARAQVAATAATRRFRAEALRAEAEKFKLGKSTAFIVAQAQRDLLRSNLSEVEAGVTYLKSLVELYRLEGALLARRGLLVPGRRPVSGEF